MLIDDAAVPVGDALDEVGRIVGAAVGKGAVRGGHLHGGGAVGHAAQGQGEVAVPVVQRDAHSGKVFAAVFHTDGLQGLDRWDVQAVLQRLAHGHKAIVGVARVFGLVAPEVGWLVQQHAGAGPPGIFHGRRIDRQGLEGRAGLPAQHGGAVQPAAGGVFPPAHNGPHRAAAGVHTRGGGLHGGAVRGVFGEHIPGILLLKDGLHGGVKGGVDAVAPGQQRFGGHIQLQLRLIQHSIHKPAVGRGGRGILQGGNLLGAGQVVFLPRQHAFLLHDAEDIASPLGIGLRIGLQGEGARRLDGRRQGRGLRGRKLLRIHPEGYLRRGLHAIGPLSEIDEVQVHLQDFVLGKLTLHLQGQPDFLQLAGDGFLAGKVRKLHQLLGDGAGPLSVAAGFQVADKRAEDARQVKAGVLVKAQILRGQKGVFHMVGEGGQGNDSAVLRAHKGGDILPLPVMDRAGLGHVGQPLRVEALPGGYVKLHQGEGRQPKEHKDQGNHDSALHRLLAACHVHPSRRVILPEKACFSALRGQEHADGAGKIGQVAKNAQKMLVKMADVGYNRLNENFAKEVCLCADAWHGC